MQKWIRDKLRKQDGEGLRLRLKKQEAWWCEGSMKELFGRKEKLSWQELWQSACMPVVLESEDEVEFRLVK